MGPMLFRFLLMLLLRRVDGRGCMTIQKCDRERLAFFFLMAMYEWFVCHAFVLFPFRLVFAFLVL
jgi:hypothetical protein